MYKRGSMKTNRKLSGKLLLSMIMMMWRCNLVTWNVVESFLPFSTSAVDKGRELQRTSRLPIKEYNFIGKSRKFMKKSEAESQSEACERQQ